MDHIEVEIFDHVSCGGPAGKHTRILVDGEELPGLTNLVVESRLEDVVRVKAEILPSSIKVFGEKRLSILIGGKPFELVPLHPEAEEQEKR